MLCIQWEFGFNFNCNPLKIHHQAQNFKSNTLRHPNDLKDIKYTTSAEGTFHFDLLHHEK